MTNEKRKRNSIATHRDDGWKHGVRLKDKLSSVALRWRGEHRTCYCGTLKQIKMTKDDEDWVNKMHNIEVKIKFTILH